MRTTPQARLRRLATVAAVGLAIVGLAGIAPSAVSAVPTGGGSSESSDHTPGHGWNHDDSDGASRDDDCSPISLRDRSDDDEEECPAPPPPSPPPPPPVEQPAPVEQPPAPAKVAAILPATVFDGNLDCGAVASQDATVDAAGVAIQRLDNADGSSCTAVPYTLTADESSLEFLKSGSPYAQFIATVDWRYELEPPAKSSTYVDFGLVPGGYELTMPPCPAAVKKNGKVVGLPSLASITPASLLALGITDMDGLPRLGDPTDNGLVQYACVGSRGNRFVNTPGDEHYLLTQTIYILGDIFIRR